MKKFVKGDRTAALTEARRLAGKNPGNEFAVFQRVGAIVAKVTLAEVA